MDGYCCWLNEQKRAGRLASCFQVDTIIQAVVRRVASGPQSLRFINKSPQFFPGQFPSLCPIIFAIDYVVLSLVKQRGACNNRNIDDIENPRTLTGLIAALFFRDFSRGSRTYGTNPRTIRGFQDFFSCYVSAMMLSRIGQTNYSLKVVHFQSLFFSFLSLTVDIRISPFGK